MFVGGRLAHASHRHPCSLGKSFWESARPVQLVARYRWSEAWRPLPLRRRPFWPSQTSWHLRLGQRPGLRSSAGLSGSGAGRSLAAQRAAVVNRPRATLEKLVQTTESKPIACTLGHEDLTSRLAEMRACTVTNLLSHEHTDRVLRLRYRREASPQLKRIVALETQCCAFLDFEVIEAASHVDLTITAPSEAGAAAGWLFAQFLPESPAVPSVASCGCSRGAACG